MALIQFPAGANAPGAPILVVVNDSYAPDPFGRYLGEILQAEGLVAYTMLDLSAVTLTELQQHDVVLLAETSLNPAQAAMFTDFVTAGGRLAALKPDAQIAGLFGLGAAAGSQTGGYLKFETGALWDGQTTGSGLVDVPLQIHGSANQYSLLAGAATLATLYSDPLTATTYPAVVGGASGRTAAFTYNLVSNIILTRQGNPANANIDVDGDGVIRTIDLFQTIGGGAPWVDLDRIPIPQADEQQRLLARVVKQLVEQARPLPQAWYFPGEAKTMLILTGDTHGNPTSYYQDQLASLTAHGANITLYLGIAGEPSDANVQTWRAQGHEFGIHPYTQRVDSFEPYNCTTLAECYTVFSDWFDLTYSSPKSRTVRNHQVAWEGWTTSAEIASAHGINLSGDFYHWGPWLQKGDNSWAHGYINGSGQTMKFVKSDGTILPVYQLNTPIVDEHMILGAGDGWEGLTNPQALAVTQALIDSSLNGDYAALLAQFHTDYYSTAQDWAEGTVDYANSQGVPVWNADQWLDFTEIRQGLQLTNFNWNPAALTLTFDAAAAPGADLSLMLPATYNGQALTAVTIDGAPQAFSFQTIKGQSTAFIPYSSGVHQVVAAYQLPPILQAVKSGANLQLSWPDLGAEVVGYEVWRADNAPYFTPGDPGSTKLADVAPQPSVTHIYDDNASGLGDLNTNSFYAVRALYAAGWSDSNRAGEIDYELHETAGADYNWIGLPLDAGLGLASELQTYIEATADAPISVATIARWNPVAQNTTVFISAVSSGDFPLQVGGAYRVFITGTGGAPAIWSLVGAVPEPAASSFTLYQTPSSDFNWITLPLHLGGLDAASLVAADINANADPATTVLTISRWNPIGQSFTTHIVSPPLSDFPVQIGAPLRITVDIPAGSSIWP